MRQHRHYLGNPRLTGDRHSESAEPARSQDNKPPIAGPSDPGADHAKTGARDQTSVCHVRSGHGRVHTHTTVRFVRRSRPRRKNVRRPSRGQREAGGNPWRNQDCRNHEWLRHPVRRHFRPHSNRRAILPRVASGTDSSTARYSAVRAARKRGTPSNSSKGKIIVPPRLSPAWYE